MALPPDGFGTPSVRWTAEVTEHPIRVLGLAAQHELVVALRAAQPDRSGRGWATVLGVNRSTVARWFSGTEAMSLGDAALCVRALAPGASLGIGELPVEYETLVDPASETLAFTEPAEPLWQRAAADLAAFAAAERREGRGRLLIAAVLAYRLTSVAISAPGLNGTAEMDAVLPPRVRFELPTGASELVLVDLSSDSAPLGDLPSALAGPLLRSVGRVRPLTAYVLSPTAAKQFDLLMRPTERNSEDPWLACSWQALAERGLVEEPGSDLTLRLRARAKDDLLTVAVVETVKSP